MGRRRRSKKSIPARMIPYDFYGTVSGVSKDITCADLGLLRNRAMRVMKVTVSAAFQYSGYSVPAMVVSLHDTKSDICTVSRPLVMGSTARTVTVHAPRFTDYGDFSHDNSSVVSLLFPAWSTGNITFAGTVWVQFAPHKVSTQVKLRERYPECYPDGDGGASHSGVHACESICSTEDNREAS